MMLLKLRQWFDIRLPDSRVAGHAAVEHTLQLAAAVFLLEIVDADSEQKEEEYAQVIAALVSVFDLTQSEVSGLLQCARKAQREMVSLHAFVRLLNEELVYEQKFFLLEQLWRVAFADGRVDKYEEHTVRWVADLLYIPHQDFIRAKHRAADRMKA